MKKGILKEIIIVLLIIIACILILGVLLYEYVPTNKIVPEKVSYTTPESVKSELWNDTDELNEEGLKLTYEIDSSDLKNYKKVQEYVAGKKNPFSSIIDTATANASNETDTTESKNTENQKDSSTTKNNNTSVIENSTGYLPDKGTK